MPRLTRPSQSRSAAVVTRKPLMVNAPTVTSCGSTASSNPCRPILPQHLFPCQRCRVACHREHRSTERTASHCLPPQHHLLKVALILRTRRLNTPLPCIRRRVRTALMTRRTEGAAGRVRQKRSTSHARLLQTILSTTTRAGGRPSRSTATAPLPIARFNRVPMIGIGLPRPTRTALAVPCHRNSSCEPRKPRHRRSRCNPSSPPKRTASRRRRSRRSRRHPLAATRTR